MGKTYQSPQDLAESKEEENIQPFKPLSGYKKPPKGLIIVKPRQRLPTLPVV